MDFSKSMSHALLTSSSPYPRTLIVRGHLMDSMGITVRSQSSSRRAKGRIELLPEEALYLLERGSLQIWVGDEAVTETDEREGVGEWKDEEYGVGGAVELGVMDGFAAFIGKDGLSWERYQVRDSPEPEERVMTGIGLCLPQTAGIHRPAYPPISPSPFHRDSDPIKIEANPRAGHEITTIQDVVDEYTSMDRWTRQKPRTRRTTLCKSHRTNKAQPSSQTVRYPTLCRNATPVLARDFIPFVRFTCHGRC